LVARSTAEFDAIRSTGKPVGGPHENRRTVRYRLMDPQGPRYPAAALESVQRFQIPNHPADCNVAFQGKKTNPTSVVVADSPRTSILRGANR
jgi:hypothetical protein